MRQPGPPESKNGLGNLFAQKNSPKASVFEAGSSQRWHDSIIFHELVNSATGYRDFFKNFSTVAH
jgi:hypothetical protein